VHIRGEAALPTAFNAWLAQLCTYLFLFGLATAFTGDLLLNPLGRLGGIIKRFKDANPLMFYAGIFLVNSLASSLLSTGAFEVYGPNHKLLFSKIQTGQVPSQDTLLSIISDQLKSY
jgi:hypothetical protein